MFSSSRRYLALVITILVVAITLSLFHTQTTAASAGGYWYTVQPGDSWWKLSQNTGIPMVALQAANPKISHYRDWLIIGEAIWIPKMDHNYYYVVRPGDSWLSVSLLTGVSGAKLRAANPKQARDAHGWLYVGDRLTVPVAGGMPQAGGTASPTAPAASPTAPATATMTPTAMLPVTATATITATVTMTPTLAPTATVTPTAEAVGGCPTSFAAYPDAIERYVNNGHTPTALRNWLNTCNPQERLPQVVVADFNGDGKADLGVVFTDPTNPNRNGLALLARQETQYKLVDVPDSSGVIHILAVRDINADGQKDVAWSDTFCSLANCYLSVHVLSWNQGQFQDWINGSATMPTATVALKDLDGDGREEIYLHGGQINSVAAGPQRTRTETWVSVNGAPYQLMALTYDPSACMYHWVLDANQLLLNGPNDHALVPAIPYYRYILSTPSLQACWTRSHELDELRSFSRFRLALAEAYNHDSAAVKQVVNEAQQAQPDALYTQVLTTWWQHYEPTHSITESCAAVNQFVTQHPGTWQMLANYGYTNPTFGPGDVCPVLSTVYGSVQATCPTSFADQADKLLRFINAHPSDIQQLGQYVRTCRLTTPTLGGIGAADLAGDGKQALIVAPINYPVSNDAQGPGHTQGRMLIFTPTANNSYTITMNIPSEGAPLLLAAEDLNQDGHMDVAWADQVCSNANCVAHLHIISYKDGHYVEWLAHPAQMPNAEITFEDRTPVGSGQEMVLYGGYAHFQGQLPVHWREIWASTQGAPYHLASIAYDNVGGSTCLRFKLREANVALANGLQIGWKDAAALYQEAIQDDHLHPCALDGTPSGVEMATLHGFARFRLAQTYAYSGNVTAAQSAVDALISENPPNVYGGLAQAWWKKYAPGHDMALACQAAADYAAAHPDTYQIFTAFANLVPVLTPQDICPVYQKIAVTAVGTPATTRPVTGTGTITTTTPVTATEVITP